MNSKQEPVVLSITRTKKDAKNSYNKMSKWYDLFRLFEQKYRTIGIKMLDPKNDDILLEIGFGTGRSILKLNKLTNITGQIYGIDLSDGMCRKAKQLLKKKEAFQNVFLNCADATHLPFRDNSIEKIFICFTLELFDIPDIALVLNECKRILMKEGKICIVSLSKYKVNIMVKLYEWFHKKMPKFIDCRPILVENILNKHSLKIETNVKKKMWGLPLEIILAEK